MKSGPLIGYENRLIGANITSGSAGSATPASNLATNLGSDPWQTAGDVTVANGAWAQADAGEAVTWRALWIGRSNLTSDATVRFMLGTTAGDDDVYDSGPLTGIEPGYQQLVHVLDAEVTARHFRLEIDDAANPDGFIRVGLAYAGPVFQPERGLSYGASFGVAGMRRDITTRGGQLYPSALYQQRQWDVSLDFLREAEMYDEGLEIQRHAEIGGNVLFVPRPGNLQAQKETVFGMIQSRATFGFPNYAQRAWPFTVTERL